MGRHQLLDSFGAQERHIAIGDQNKAGLPVQEAFSLHDSVTGAKLLFLNDKTRRFANHRLHRFSPMPNHDDRGFGANSAGGVEGIKNHRLAANLVQHLG